MVKKSKFDKKNKLSSFSKFDKNSSNSTVDWLGDQ